MDVPKQQHFKVNRAALRMQFSKYSDCSLTNTSVNEKVALLSLNSRSDFVCLIIFLSDSPCIRCV